MSEHEPDGEKKIRLSTLAYAAAILAVAVVGVGSILAYGTNTAIGKKIAGSMSQVIPYPAAIIGYSDVVYMKDVRENLASIEKFYRTQDLHKEGLRVDFTTPDGQKRLRIKEREILDKLVEDKIIEILAEKQGISVSEQDVDKAVTEQLALYGTTNDVKNDLLNAYGWSLEDFKRKVIMPNMYKDGLIRYVAQQNPDHSKPKAKIEQAKKQLESGKDFAQVVSEFSEGSSKADGGELGWVGKQQVAPELQDALFAAKPPAKNSIIESSIGFHIMDIEDRKKENGGDVLRLRQIFVAKDTFADWLEDQKKKMRVMVLMGDFTWDGATGSVDFRSQGMRTFEKDERAKARGDASLMF